MLFIFFFFFKQKTAYEMRISDWSSDVCSSDLQFGSFRDPLIVMMSVPMAIFGAMIFIFLGVKKATLNIYTEVGLVTLIGLISKHGILIVQFANDEQKAGRSKWDAIMTASGIDRKSTRLNSSH